MLAVTTKSITPSLWKTPARGRSGTARLTPTARLQPTLTAWSVPASSSVRRFSADCAAVRPTPAPMPCTMEQGSMAGDDQPIGSDRGARCAGTEGGRRYLGREASMWIDVTPERSLADEPLRIVVGGAPPGGRVTVRAALRDDAAQRWASWGAFVADAGGMVDLAKQAPVDGTWDTADPLGLIWSMRDE